jgi:hypothetical protein
MILRLIMEKLKTALSSACQLSQVKDNIPDWKVQTNEWNVEDSRAWRTEDTDKFFYEIEEKKNDTTD